MSLSKNIFYNAVYQVLVIILPFITIPIVTNALGSNGVGVFTFTDSVIHYFVFFGLLGTNIYGSRAIGYVRENLEKRSKVFWSIFILKLFTVILASIVFYFSIFVRLTEYKLIYELQMINLLTAAVDISWFFMGMEQVKTIVFRNTVLKVTAFLAIVLFIKRPEDLWLYTLIMTGSNCMAQVLIWGYLKKYVVWVKINRRDIIGHVVPILSLLILQIATEVYFYLDKILLGIYGTKAEVGVYDMSQKLVRLSLAIITSMTAVIIPRVSNYYANNDIKAIKQVINKVFRLTNYLSVPIMFGIYGIITEFAPWFFGAEFGKVPMLTYIIAPIIVIIPWGNVVGMQLMIPMGKDLLVSLCPITGAVVNVILNLILLPRYGAVGAAIALLSAETAGSLLSMYLMRSFLNFREMFTENYKYVITSVIMFICIRVIGTAMGVGKLTTMVQIMVSVCIYMIGMKLLKSTMNEFIIDKVMGTLRLKVKQTS